LEGLWRGHWEIENKVHYVRDETMGEDRGQMRRGNAAQALAALRNGVLSLLRSQGVKQIADALRHHGSSVEEALAFIGIAL
jgi:predicted transposase YbfD/YdcC